MQHVHVITTFTWESSNTDRFTDAEEILRFLVHSFASVVSYSSDFWGKCKLLCRNK